LLTDISVILAREIHVGPAGRRTPPAVRDTWSAENG
jgi:hypothetical protein